MGTTPRRLQLAHHRRVVGMLRDDPAAGNAPGISPLVIKRAGRFVAIEIIIECNGRFSGEQGINPADYLPDRFLSPFSNIAKTDRPANEFFWPPYHMADLLDLGEGCGCSTKIFSRHRDAGYHNKKIRPVQLSRPQGIGPELVDCKVLHPAAMVNQCPGHGSDIGRDIRWHAKACGFVDVAIEDESHRTHT